MLIGTHRLLSQDVKPKDLGLVIVDEEQRFGVAQKEALRRLKVKVDVLTLTATPIPRTLQMSLSGVRDITVIETPPRDRHPIQTYVGLYDEGMVEAGHRARDRPAAARSSTCTTGWRPSTRPPRACAPLMPQCASRVAHGQMPEQELEQVMLDFLRGDYDVLVTTTIIESGLDIPNANTLIVERADLLGLAQLYQIRGRIGRSAGWRTPSCSIPDEAVLTEEAVARLSTLADYTELGSGFKIAMRDLEIRGAGRAAGGGAVGSHRRGGLRDVPVHAARGRGTAAGRGAGPARSCRGWIVGLSTRTCPPIHRLRSGPGGPAPADRLGAVRWRSWPTCAPSWRTASARCRSRWTT